MNSFKIECNENVDNYYNDVVVNSCHNDIELSNDNIYEIDGIDYFGETIEKYYTICPNLGIWFLLIVMDLMNQLRKMLKIRIVSKCIYLLKINLNLNIYILIIWKGIWEKEEFLNNTRRKYGFI